MTRLTYRNPERVVRQQCQLCLVLVGFAFKICLDRRLYCQLHVSVSSKSIKTYSTYVRIVHIYVLNSSAVMQNRLIRKVNILKMNAQ